MKYLPQVELLEEKRHLDTKSKYMVSLQRRGIIKDVSLSYNFNNNWLFIFPISVPCFFFCILKLTFETWPPLYYSLLQSFHTNSNNW